MTPSRHITTNDTCACHVTDNNNLQMPHHRWQHCPSLPQRMWVPHNWHLQNRRVGVRKIRRSQKEGSGRMRRRGGNHGGSKGREEGTGAPPPCSVVPEASEAACNSHAASPELLYPPNNKGFMESTTGQHDTHALPWFPSFTPSTRVFFSCSIDDDNGAACNLHAALFVLVLSYPPVVGGILPLWHQ